MTQYKKEYPFPILFPPEVPKNVLAECLALNGVPQYHVAGIAYGAVTIFQCQF